MEDTPKKPTPPTTAKPRGISLYDDQYEFAEKKAKELTKRGKPSASRYIQQLLDDAMKREEREKQSNP